MRVCLKTTTYIFVSVVSSNEMYCLLLVTILFGSCCCVIDDTVPETCLTGLCSPDCGRSVISTSQLDLGGTNAKEGDLPWHAIIYSKESKYHKQICGGTIIAPTLVLSAAHCFWSDVEKLKPASRFAVAAGKLYRAWNSPRDAQAQKSDVKYIRIQSKFRGMQTYLESDIAVLHLTTKFVYNSFVRPVCLDFDLGSDRRQLTPNNLGIVSAWGLSGENIKATQTLQIINVPFLDAGTCSNEVPVYFKPYLIWDKICAAYPNGTALCDRDRGGGFVFPVMDGSVQRYYLRGIFSTAPYDDQSGCSAHAAMMTHLRIYEAFIEEQLTGAIKPTACQLPPYPDHGRYNVMNNPKAFPGDVLDSYFLEYECDPGYATLSVSNVYCVNGFQSKAPKCEKVCRLDPHPSVEYLCHVPNSYSGRRQCEQFEPNATTVTANCRAPNYFSNQILRVMKCSDGAWNYVAKCLAVCGASTPKGDILLSGGRVSEVGEIPWHVGIYSKETTPYKQICGGSIIETTMVISAAHCFWSDYKNEVLPASQYAVAAGKHYKQYDDARDNKAQKIDVIDIKIPERFRGRHTSYQDDIALVFLAKPLQYDFHIRPVCIDFGIILERKQLTVGNLGKVAGWGFLDADGKEAQELQVVKMPYIDIKQCLDDAPFDFRQYITGDKICAGYTNGTGLCKGDSGGGLAFPEIDKGEERFYLRGVVSTAPQNTMTCNVYAVTAFTQVWRHELFIKENYFGA